MWKKKKNWYGNKCYVMGHLHKKKKNVLHVQEKYMHFWGVKPKIK